MIKLGVEAINAGGVGGSLVQESPVVYRNVLGRKTEKIDQNPPHRRAAQDDASMSDLLKHGQCYELKAEFAEPSHD